DRLRRPDFLTRQPATGKWFFFDGEYRLAGQAIKQKDITMFRDLSNRINGPAVFVQCDEVRRGSQVAVPYVMMHDLKMPYVFAGCCFERKKRIGKKVLSFPKSSIE